MSDTLGSGRLDIPPIPLKILIGVLMSPSRFYGRGLGLKSGYVVQIFESCVRHIQFQAVLFRFVNTPTPGNVQRNNLTRSRFPFEFYLSRPVLVLWFVGIPI